MTSPRLTLRRLTAVYPALSGLFLALIEMPASSAQVASLTPGVPQKPAAANSGEPLVLSPFEVRSDDRGYLASNTMSGTRLNSKVEDLASSITVITKEQMSDFAMLDLNDIFLYEAGTEGTGTFTDYAFDRNGAPLDNTQLNPGNANRIRGVGPANTASGNFETSGRVPMDPINMDSVEISRGPNANVFGLGNASGTVNVQPASAHLTRNRSQLTARVDSFDGYRSTLDLNRVLLKNVLAVRGNAVVQHEGFDRKPSGTDTRRYNGMVKYQPFKFTTLSASFSYYKNAGNRPNTTTPRDAVTGWRNAGSPLWDPVTSRVTVNGVTGTAAIGIGALPRGLLNTAGTGRTNSTLFVDGNGTVGWWGATQGSSTTNPATRDVAVFLVNSQWEDVRAGQSLFSNQPNVSDKSIYDWSSINLAAVNRLRDLTRTTHLEFEQIILNTPRQLLALEAGFFREDSERYRRDLMGTADSQGSSGNLFVDPNQRLPDGSVNPFVGRTFVGVWRPSSNETPLLRNTYRTQLAYRLDLRQEKSPLHWLGMHQLSGYGEYKDVVQRRVTYRDAIISDHPWLPAGTPRSDPSTVVTINYFRYYVGDAAGQNVDYGPAPFALGQYPYRWGNALTNNIKNETATIGQAIATDATAAGGNTHQILKTRGAVLQSYWLQDRLITTFGLRNDRNYNTTGVSPVLQPDGIHVNESSLYQWAARDWAFNQGRTKTAGVVAKPLKWLYLHANASDSFQPNSYAVDLHLNPLPDPSGKGKDYGFSLNLLNGRLFARINRYETKQVNSRNGQSATLATRLRGLDFDTQNRAQTPFSLVPLATGWVTRAAAAKGQTLTKDQVDTQVSTLIGLDKKYLPTLTDDLAETEDVVAKGTEVELNYNPTAHWTLKLNLTRQESINSNMAPGMTTWLAERLAIWQKLIDPELNRPWFTERYGNIASASELLAANVTAPLGVAKATEGKSRPQVRKYRANLSTSYRLAGLTDQKYLKRFTVGGALRWEDRGAIGYRGLQQLPAIITDLDPNNPIWDKAHLYIDSFVTYRTRLFADKVGTTFQLNVRNLQEGGRLQPISAYPNGRFSGFRIVDPRQFILTATFDL
ncbi:MAG: TonB-dependent receptor [Opitutus sp.]|nr:TonB-dependent receptor [Opitutus sp.]